MKVCYFALFLKLGNIILYGGCDTVCHCRFNFHLSDEIRHWVSFFMFIGHWTSFVKFLSSFLHSFLLGFLCVRFFFNWLARVLYMFWYNLFVGFLQISLLRNDLHLHSCCLFLFLVSVQSIFSLFLLWLAFTFLPILWPWQYFLCDF